MNYAVAGGDDRPALLLIPGQTESWWGYESAMPRLAERFQAFEYDPEWGRAFWTGTVAASCDHAKMLSRVKVPILLTHHFRLLEETTDMLMGALSDLQAARARDLITAFSPSTTGPSPPWAMPCMRRTRSCSPAPSSIGRIGSHERAELLGTRPSAVPAEV